MALSVARELAAITLDKISPGTTALVRSETPDYLISRGDMYPPVQVAVVVST
jgi:hypothetical protein